MRYKKRSNGSKFKSLLFWFTSLSIVKHILFTYLLITALGSLILFLPFSQQGDVSVSYIDALFTAASAFSDTGLTTMVTSQTWSLFGQAVITMLILSGGIGWFSLKVYVFGLIFGKAFKVQPLSINARDALSAERGSVKIGVTRNLIIISLTILFVVIIASTIGLTFYFYFVEVDMNPNLSGIQKTGPLGASPHLDFFTSFRYGLFHSISAINNAGFDIIGPQSLAPYYVHYGLQFIFVILFVIGGVGFPVIYDVYLWVHSKFSKKNHRWTLFTKLSVLTYFIIAFLALGLTFVLEINASGNSFWASTNNGSAFDKSMAIFFNTMSTRNAGFSTVDMHSFTSGTLFLYIALMFVGSSPSSTAGGIRTTTMAIIILALWKQVRGHEKVRVFNRSIKESTVSRAFVVFVTSILLIFIVSFIGMTSFGVYGGKLSSTDHSFLDILFEVTSAFGTTGLTTGITESLSIVTKIALILVMFIGQLSVSSTLLVWGSRNEKSRAYSYVVEDITIG